MDPALEPAPNISRRGAKIFGKSEDHWVMNPVTPAPIPCNCWPYDYPSSFVCISSASLSDKIYMYDNDSNRTYDINHLPD